MPMLSMTTLFVRETAEFPLPDGQHDFDNTSFWRNMNEFPYLKRVAALFAGRPPSQVEDKRQFSQTGVIVTPRRARLYPDHVEQKYFVAECIEFFWVYGIPLSSS